MKFYQKLSHILIVFILVLSQHSQAAEIKSSEAIYKGKIFFINASGFTRSSPQKIFALLTDYQNLTQVSPKIIESKIIQKNDDVTVVRVVTKSCVWFMCKEIINTQTASFIINDDTITITSTTLPLESNLEIGKMIWKIKAIGPNKDKTEISYSAEIKPDFFVPPIIGTFFVKNIMSNEAKLFIQSIENLALTMPN